ncbi:MAG: TIGR03435 family protein [Bryobacteraceae bacterium]
MKRIPAMLAVALLPWFGAAAQSGGGAPAFELASVRPARPGRGGAPRFAVTPGRLTVQNTSLRHIILEAYGVEDYRLRGPDWIDSERYDIVAKSPASVRRHAEMMPMLKALLADRFQLEVHHESKELEVYALIVSKQGHKLQAAKAGEAAGQKGREDEGHIHFESLRMGQLAAILSGLLRQPVVDQTGVEGSFAVWLDWTPGHADAAAGAAPPNASLFVALNELLGLGLQMRKAPLDVLIIDRVEKLATEN